MDKTPEKKSIMDRLMTSCGMDDKNDFCWAFVVVGVSILLWAICIGIVGVLAVKWFLRLF